MSKLDDLIARRTEERRRTAEAAAARVLDALHAQGIAIRLFGSLVRGGFKDHSDVDFLVRGPVTPAIAWRSNRRSRASSGSRTCPTT